MSRYAISTSVRGMGRKQRLFLRYQQKHNRWVVLRNRWAKSNDTNLLESELKWCRADYKAERKLLRYITLIEYGNMLNKEG